MPWKTRKAMSHCSLGEMAQSPEPTVKIASAVMKTTLLPRRSLTKPVTGMTAACAKR